MDKKKNVLEILLDDKNDEAIVFYDYDNNSYLFEQVAVIPFDDNNIYAVLKPIDPAMLDMPDDEAVVFRVDYDETDEPYLVIETDDTIADIVFEKYYRLLAETE